MAQIDIGSSKNRNYEPSLDYLRALAAIIIFIYHTTVTYRGYNSPPPDWINTSWPLFWNPIVVFFVEGHTAVTLFMVMSGYVLTKGVVGKKISYGIFLTNRMLRILPLYIFVTMFGVSIHPETFSINGLIQTLLPFANIRGAIQSEVLTALFWSIAVEFQFYLLFPFIKRFIESQGVSFGARVICLFFLFRIIALFYIVNMRDFTYLTIFGRMDQFVIGMMLAFFPVPRWSSHWVSFPAVMIGTLALLLFFHRLGGYPVYEWWKLFWPSAEAIAWATVILVSLNSPYRMPLFARSVLIFISNMSFSIYILHSTVLQIFGERNLYIQFSDHLYANAILNSILLLPIVLALSWVTFMVIEKPFMEMRRKYIS